MNSPPGKQNGTEDEDQQKPNQDTPSEDLKWKNKAERHENSLKATTETTTEEDSATLLLQPSSAPGLKPLPRASLSFLEQKNEVMSSFRQQQGFRDEKGTIVGMLLAEQHASRSEQKLQHANQQQSSRSLSSTVPLSSPSPPPNCSRLSRPPSKTHLQHSTSEFSTSSATNNAHLNRAWDSVRFTEGQGAQFRSSHLPGAYQVNTPAENRPHPSTRRMFSFSSLHSSNGRLNEPTTEQDREREISSIAANISAEVVRADNVSLQQQFHAEAVDDVYLGERTEEPTPVEAGGTSKRRGNIILVMSVAISLLLVGGGVAGLVLAEGKSDHNEMVGSEGSQEPEGSQDNGLRCGMHPQDLLMNCHLKDGGARALIPECAEAAYESLPPTISNQTSLTSCSARDLAHVSLALQLANYNDSVKSETRAMFLTLATLYYSTDGPNWARDQSWFVDRMSPCSWFGITCDPSGTEVVAIGLEQNNLVGSLPTELFLLTKLTALMFALNDLMGSIPSQIGQLVELRSIDFEKCPLDGTLPSELGLLTLLEVLRLTDNSVAGTIPSEIGYLTSMTTLSLQTLPNLSGILPTELAMLSNLKSLSVVSTSFRLAPIQKYNFNMPDLEILHLQNIALTGTIPSEIFSMKRLELLNLGSNRITGTLGTGFGNLQNLKSLGLPYNFLEGTLPSELGELEALTVLNIESNSFTGTIPSEIGQLGLRLLAISWNDFSGTVPEEVCDLGSVLEHIDGNGNLVGCPRV